MANIPEGFSRVGVIGTYWHNTEWNENEVYYQWNAVPYQGSSYLALVDNPSGPPTNDGINWLIIAKRGDDGAGGVTGIRGEAEEETADHKGLVVLTKEMLGLENVENKSAAVILSELTKEQVEALLETPDLSSILDKKADIEQFDSYTLQNVTKETLETILEHADIAETLDGKIDRETAKEELELDHVDNLSFEEIKEKLTSKESSGIIPEDINAVEKFVSPEELSLYSAKPETAQTQPIKTADSLERIGEVFNATDKQAPVPEDYDPYTDRLPFLVPLMATLKGGYYNWIIEQMLLDVHPVTGVKGEAEDKFNSDRVIITKESIGLKEVPDQHPDTFGAGFLYSGLCASGESENEKVIAVQDGFTLQDGRLLIVTFMENNLASEITFNVNECGSHPVNIKTFPVAEYNCETFQKYGSYLFQFDGESWNYLTGSNGIIDVRFFTLEADQWILQENETYANEISLEHISGQEEIQVDILLDPEDENYAEKYSTYIHAQITEGVLEDETLTLYALNQPEGEISLQITVQA